MNSVQNLIDLVNEYHDSIDNKKEVCERIINFLGTFTNGSSPRKYGEISLNRLSQELVIDLKYHQDIEFTEKHIRKFCGTYFKGRLLEDILLEKLIIKIYNKSLTKTFDDFFDSGVFFKFNPEVLGQLRDFFRDKGKIHRDELVVKAIDFRLENIFNNVESLDSKKAHLWLSIAQDFQQFHLNDNDIIWFNIEAQAYSKASFKAKTLLATQESNKNTKCDSVDEPNQNKKVASKIYGKFIKKDINEANSYEEESKKEYTDKEDWYLQLFFRESDSEKEVSGKPTTEIKINSTSWQFEALKQWNKQKPEPNICFTVCHTSSDKVKALKNRIKEAIERTDWDVSPKILSKLLSQRKETISTSIKPI
jgi:hypothetical protein